MISETVHPSQVSPTRPHPSSSQAGRRPRRAAAVRIARRAAGPALLALLSACSPAYVVRAGLEEARLLARRRPITDVIADPATDPALRAKLELVLEVREFARRDLGLDAGDSYRHYSDVGRDTLALVLSASPPDRLAAKTWWFPIVGRVPYLGFFDPERARERERELQTEGYDTYLRPTIAFSTLGWLPDPLLSTALADDSLGLAETVVHELTHNTWFVRGHVPFNESFAHFSGLAGAAAFFCEKNPDGSHCREASGRWTDAVLLSELYEALADSLRDLYARELPRAELLAERSALLTRFQRRFLEETLPRMASGAWSRLDLTRLNNASFLARHLYYRRLRWFDDVYRRSPELPALLRRLGESALRADDPWTALARLRDGGGTGG